MAVNVVDLSAIEWQDVPATWAGKAGPGEPKVRFKAFTTGDSGMPNGQLIEYEAGHTEAEHSHDEGELYYMLTGDLTIQSLSVGPGVLVCISAGTRYSNRTEDGCSFIRLGIAATTDV
jgi:quercetin dioxygenase-like cupin family protein